jgi:hypothetical protein
MRMINEEAGYRVLVWQDEKVLEVVGGGGFLTV